MKKIPEKNNEEKINFEFLVSIINFLQEMNTKDLIT